MCKKLFFLTSFVLVLGSGAGQTWGAYRAAYWDSDFTEGWIDEYAIEMRDHFDAAGYEILDADQLKTWMDARIDDGKLSAVVFCQDRTPETVCETNTADCTLRKYLDAGGKVVFHSDIPFWNQSNRGGSNTLWKGSGATGILGFEAAGPGSIRNSYQVVQITEVGLEWGLTETWESRRPADASVVEAENLTVLATDDAGHAAAWVKHYVPGDTTRGFVRVFDTDAPKPNFDDFKRLAEYGLTDPELAGAPSPVHTATDVSRTVVLSWQSGENGPAVSGHKVFFSDDFNEVNDSIDGLILDTNEYIPDPRLEYGVTYYWRVDEADETEWHTGNIWSFQVEPFSLPIGGDSITVATDSNDAGQGPENTINGSGLDEDVHSQNLQDMWLSDHSEPNQAWIQYAFDRTYKLDQVMVWNHNGQTENVLGWGVKDALIEYSTDGIQWTSLGVVELTRATVAPFSEVDLQGVSARSVRVTAQSNWGGMFDQYGLSEVQFSAIPLAARKPMPDSGTTDVDPRYDILSWRSGREAGQHDVYLSADSNAMGSATTVTDNSLALASLDLALDTTYYWQVNEVNEVMVPSTWAGDLWDLTTVDSFVVDDFENYDNISPDRPFQTWIDGVGFTTPEPGNPGNNTGSAIGHDIWSVASPHFEGDIMETGSTATGTGLSMPVYYDNSGADGKLTYSQVDFPVGGENWTVNGVQTLSIAFRGTAGNTGTLYAKINNTKIPYDLVATDIAVAAWQVFNIDLTTVNGGVTSVQTLSIGIDGSGASGMILIDDIKLYDQPGELITPVTPDNAGLKAQYAFEGNIIDSSGNNLNGTLANALAQVSAPGASGQALQLQPGGYVDLGNPASLDFGTGDWTIAAWIKTGMTGTGDANKGTIVGKGGDGSGGHRYALIMSESTEGVVTLVTDDNVDKIVVNSNTPINDDQWHFVVGQRQGSDIRIYIDGQLENTGSAANTSAQPYDLAGTVQHNAYVGAITNNASGVLYKMFGGSIDEVVIYGRALSAEEILWLAGRTTPIHKSF